MKKRIWMGRPCWSVRQVNNVYIFTFEEINVYASAYCTVSLVAQFQDIVTDFHMSSTKKSVLLFFNNNFFE